MPASALPDTSKTILYNFDNSDPSLKFGAPRLVPKVKTGVNVTQDFPWTTLPGTNRDLVPSVELREYRITSSTLIQSFIQQARSSVDAVGGTGENIVSGVKKGLSILGFSITDADISNWLDSTINVTNQSFLDPYKHLYPVKPTDWIYTFPFLTNQNQRTSNDWSNTDNGEVGGAVKETMTDSVAGGAIGNVLNALQVASKTSKIGNLFEPGSYTETIKHYTPSEGESYKVNFTLYNTIQYSDIQRNWELCFILTYQNRSNRRSVSLLDPPVIYSVSIPGVSQMLYAYISNLEISNMGTSRYVDFDGIGRKLIPEAYNISFDLKSLLTPTQNLLLYAHTNSKIDASVQ